MRNLKEALEIYDFPRPSQRAADLRRQILHECKISRTSLWNWASNPDKIPFWAEPILERILTEKQ